jgi:hypothetical protein
MDISLQDFLILVSSYCAPNGVNIVPSISTNDTIYVRDTTRGSVYDAGIYYIKEGKVKGLTKAWESFLTEFKNSGLNADEFILKKKE